MLMAALYKNVYIIIIIIIIVIIILLLTDSHEVPRRA